MADFTITVTNTVNTFGPAPSTKWGAAGACTPYFLCWGTDKWGEGSQDLIVSVTKIISNSQSLDSAVHKNPNKLVSSEITPLSETTSETLADGSGYTYVFVAPATDAERRDQSVFTSTTVQSTSWGEVAVSSTSWS